MRPVNKSLSSMVRVTVSRARVGIAIAIASLGLVTTAHAAAEFGPIPGSFKADTFDPGLGGPDNRAGAHPNEAFTDFDLNLQPSGDPVGGLHGVSNALPEGFVGDPTATPTCSRGVFDAFVSAYSDTFTPEYCPVSSQVGYAVVRGVGTTQPVFNLEPSPGEAADFAFIVQSVPVHIIPSLDPARNYALDVRVDKVSRAIPVTGTRVVLWVFPPIAAMTVFGRATAARACRRRSAR